VAVWWGVFAASAVIRDHVVIVRQMLASSDSDSVWALGRTIQLGCLQP
jgi:hypothetical protein